MLKKRFFQLKLPQRDLVPGGFIALLSRGRLKEPTEDTVEKCIRLNLKFDDLHGKGTSTRECKHTEIKTAKYLIRRCADIEPRFIKLFTRVKYTKKIKDKYEERLIQRRTEAKKMGKKYKFNRDFMKDGHFSSQKKGSMLNIDTREFYNDLFFCNDDDGGSITTTAGTSGSTSSSKGTIRKRTALVEKSSNANLDEDEKYVSGAKRKRKAKTSVSKAIAAKKPRKRENKANKKNDTKNVKELKDNGGIGRNYDDCKQNVSAEKATGGEGVEVNSVPRSVVEGSQELNVVSSSVK